MSKQLTPAYILKRFFTYFVQLKVKHERISEPLIHAGVRVASGCRSTLGLVCRPAVGHEMREGV